MRIIRVILESAALYTVQLFIIIVLYFNGHPAQWVVQMSMFPSTGKQSKRDTHFVGLC